jgi:hypothetical protein
MVIRRFCPSNDFARQACAAMVASLVFAQGCTRQGATSDRAGSVDLDVGAGNSEESDGSVVGEPSAADPVKAAMRIRPAAAAPGELVDAIVYARIAPAHYLHAASDSDTTFKPVSIEVKLPDTLESSEDWQFPSPIEIRGDTRGYRDSIMIRRSLKIASGTKPQTVTLAGTLRFQACTDELCWPPGEIALSAPLVIQSKAR